MRAMGRGKDRASGSMPGSLTRQASPATLSRDAGEGRARASLPQKQRHIEPIRAAGARRQAQACAMG